MKNGHANLSLATALACVLFDGCAGSGTQALPDSLRAKLEAREAVALSQIAAPQQEIPETSAGGSEVSQPRPAPLVSQPGIAPSQGMTAAPLNMP